MAVSLVASFLALLSVLGFLYGIFFSLFCASTFLLIKRQRQLNEGAAARLRRPVWRTVPFVASILLFATITPFWCINVYDSFQAFLYFEGGKQPLLYYSDLGSLRNGMSVTVLNQLVPFIGDSIMIYRLYMIWARNKLVVIPPLLSLIGLVVCDVLIDYVIANAQWGIDNHVFMRLKDIVPANCTLSLFTNVYCCVLISWKLYSHLHMQPHKATGIRVMHVLTIFIESAALYVAAMAVYVGVYVSGAVVQALFGEIMVPITGIAFTLINVRVGLGYAGASGERATARRAGASSFAEGPIVIDAIRDVELDSLDRRKADFRAGT